MIQCARICFGLSGVYDPDEAQRISFSNPLASNTRQHIDHQSQNSPNSFSQHQSAGNYQHGSQSNAKESNLGATFVKNWVKKHPGSLQTTPN
jgi:hypothetical protein